MSDTELVDPLGRYLLLHDRTWFGHIVRGHPEMELMRRDVEGAITNPEQIRRSVSDGACRQFYSRMGDNGIRIVVVADIELGLVKTAYLVKKIKGGELEWSQLIP